ncbi:hypothetical protein PG988_001147 [Apiospora saccharicola]
MRVAMLPTALLALMLPAAVHAQFKYPPPLDRPLTDYTSGLAQSPLNFSEGDNMFGGWYTPGRLKSYMLYRCTHTPSSTPIRPSNSTFWDRQGRLSKSGDGTWEQMPLLEMNSGFETGFDSGKNPIWFHGDFFAPNATTGNLCWFELLPGTEGREKLPEASDMTEGGIINGGYVRTATVHGGSDWYFATVPFEVHPRRASGLTVTWKNGTPGPDIFSHSKENVAAFVREFPQYAKSWSSASKDSAAADGVRPLQGVGFWLGTVGFALVTALN